MPITIEEVRHVARLARLDLDEAEILALQGKLNALLGHFMDIQHIDVSSVEPRSNPLQLENVWAEDGEALGLSRDEVFRNAPVSRAGLFVVPTIIEG